MDAGTGPPLSTDQEANKKLRVAVRIRPFLQEEGKQESWYAGADSGALPLRTLSVRVAKGGVEESSEYGVDSCWGPQSSGQSVFAQEVAPLLRDTVCFGYHTTVFTHGASGSGKTHTMTGTAEDPGMTPLAVAELLRMREAVGGACELQLSFLEVYLDRCYDLLDPKGELVLLEDAAGDARLPALTQVPLTSAAAFEAAWVAGCARRHSAATACNATSSRSHTMLTITAHSTKGTRRTTGKLNLVDLAGFEDNRRTGNEGQRMLESGHINASLFALHKVLRGLTSGQRHVAYRDSKLTRLLRDSLGGTSRTLLLLCLSPGRAQFGEAQTSLGLAGLAREVRNHPTAHSQDARSPAPGHDRAAALQAWRQAKGRTTNQRVLEQLPRQRRNSRDPSASPLLTVIPLDAATRLAQLEVQLQQRCHSTPSSEVITADADERSDKENVPASGRVAFGTPSSSPSPSCCTPASLPFAAEAVPQCPKTPLQQLRQTQDAATVSAVLSPPAVLCDLFTGAAALRPFAFALTRVRRMWVQQEALERECLAVLNHGDRHQLLSLRGIGPKRAEAVLALRAAAGGEAVFHSKEDLRRIGVQGKQVTSIFKVDLLKEVPSNQCNTYS